MLPAIKVLQSIGKIYATDYWDFHTLRPTPIPDLLTEIAADMHKAKITKAQMVPVLERVFHSFYNVLFHTVTEKLQRCGTIIKDSPKVGEWWGDRTGHYAGKAVRVLPPPL